MKKAVSFFEVIIPIVPYAVFFLILVGCTGSTSDKSKNGNIRNRYPAGLMKDNLIESSDVLHVDNY